MLKGRGKRSMDDEGAPCSEILFLTFSSFFLLFRTLFGGRFERSVLFANVRIALSRTFIAGRGGDIMTDRLVGVVILRTYVFELTKKIYMELVL